MKISKYLVFALIITLTAIFFLFFNKNEVKVDSENIFSKLVGKWKITEPSNGGYEYWKMGEDGSISGKSFHLDEKDTIIDETSKIMKKKKNIYYISKVMDQNNGVEIFFRHDSSTTDSILFINNEHDFPKKISYKFISDDSLHATISNELKAFEFRMRKMY